ncbi:MAG: ribonuclease P protein component [Thiovulaceae bacterium]|nr:ribonuclease P protein component [Sulfurimonadaceae bacterium]
MSGFLSLTKSADFNRIYKRGRYGHTNTFVLYYLPGEINYFAVVASKKVGNAIHRNSAKRRLRAIFSNSRNEIPTGSYILVAKKAIHETSYRDLLQQWKESLDKTLGKKR